MSSRVLLLAVLAAIFALSLGAPVLLRPSGSTVPSALLSKWKSDFFTATRDNVNMAYLAQQTGVVKQLFISNAVDFALVDVPLTIAEKEQSETLHSSAIAHAPLAATGLAIAFNSGPLGVSRLNLNAALISKIFSGEISQWNDTALVDLNAALEAVTQPIKPVVLEGKFGSTFVLTRYLNLKGASSNIASYTIGTANAKKVQSSSDAADALLNTPYSIGYLPYGEVLSHSLASASIMNEDGQYVAPSFTGFEAAELAAEADLPASGSSVWSDSFLLARQSATGNAYPLSFYVFAVFNVEQGPAGANGAAVAAFLAWAQTPAAQNSNVDYGFAKLNAAAARINNATVHDMTYAPGMDYTDYWPKQDTVPTTPQTPPAAPPTLTVVKSSAIQVIIIIALVAFIIAVIGYDQYRGGCIIKCNSTGRGVWA